MKTLSWLILFVSILLFANTFILSANIIPKKPDCLQLVDSSAFGKPYNNGLIMIDTCQNSPTYNLKFAFRGIIWFKVKATHLPYNSNNSITIDTNWTVIDTAYPLLRSFFKKIDSLYGQMIFHKSGLADTSDIFINQYFGFEFVTYVPMKPIDSMRLLLPDSLMDFAFHNGFPREQIDDVYEPLHEQTLPTIMYNVDKNEVNIDTKEQKNGKVFLYDIMGNIVSEAVLEAGKGQISVSALSTGTYFVQYGKYTKKILIEGKR